MEEPDIVSIFPPEDGSPNLSEYPPIVYAQRDLESLPKSNEKEERISVIIDDEVNDQVVEIIGCEANLGFALTDVDLQYMIFHVKNMKRFFRFDLVIQDTKGQTFEISASNRQTLIRVKSNSVSLPIILSEGWNRICLDLRDIAKRSFGVEYNQTTVVRVYANCRIWRLFFQDKDYADDQLPYHLRVVEEEIYQ